MSDQTKGGMKKKPVEVESDEVVPKKLGATNKKPAEKAPPGKGSRKKPKSLDELRTQSKSRIEELDNDEDDA